ncbi:MAG: hypothetical protein IPJ41_02820 [Phycisphaerales bacterium]|nr:hypothetical protein [Phycisphaerales bacterium]
MNTPETTQAVFAALLDPAADLLELSNELKLPLTEILAIAESPEITAAIEALERLALIRSRVQIALSRHTAIATLERIAAQEAQTSSALETARKAAAQILRIAASTSPEREPKGTTEREADPLASTSPEREPGGISAPHPDAGTRADAAATAPDPATPDYPAGNRELGGPPAARRSA